MKDNPKAPHASPKAPLPQIYKKMGLLKYDCPNLDCHAWFVTFDPVEVICNDCQQMMIDTEVL